jgi:hypothetical protein
LLPLPLTNQGGTTVIQSSGAVTASSGTSTATLSAKSITLSTGVLAPGAPFFGAVLMAKSFQLLQVFANAKCEVRLYGTSVSQGFDAARTTDEPVPPETVPNIISSVALDQTPYQWYWQNRIGANADSPQSKTIYVTVKNISATDAASLTVTISFLPLES